MATPPHPEAKLHVWRIDPRQYARHEARRGRRHAFEQLEPARTALIVIDMIPFFVVDGPYCRGIVPNIRALATSLRSAAGLVAWVLPAADAAMSAARREFFGPAERSVNTVLITGTVTNVCCESSARDASTLGYRVIMVADANAGVTDECHNATLHTIYRSFGDVRPTSEVLELIERRSAGASFR